MKDINMEEEIARSMFSQTKMMLSKQNLGEIIDHKEEIDFQSAEKMIIRSLEHTIDELHWVGHNVIYLCIKFISYERVTKMGR